MPIRQSCEDRMLDKRSRLVSAVICDKLESLQLVAINHYVAFETQSLTHYY